MHLSDDEVARIAYAANNALQAIINDMTPSPPWPAAPGWLQESYVSGVRAARGQNRTPEDQHNSWMSYYLGQGWTCGPYRDWVEKTHPCLVPYSELPEGQRLKDALFLRVVHTFTQEGDWLSEDCSPERLNAGH
jgi:hypothetical protein